MYLIRKKKNQKRKKSQKRNNELLSGLVEDVSERGIWKTGRC
jgi:hypothetical protein